MDLSATYDPYDYSNQRLLREKASECAELRELLVLVVADLERLACEHPELSSRFLARSQRLTCLVSSDQPFLEDGRLRALD